MFTYFNESMPRCDSFPKGGKGIGKNAYPTFSPSRHQSRSLRSSLTDQPVSLSKAAIRREP